MFVYGFCRWSFYGFRRGRELLSWFPSLFFLWFPSWRENVFYGLRSYDSKRGPRRAEGGMPPIRHKPATALGTRRRAVIVASSCAAQRPRILTWPLGCVGSILGARFFKVIAFACFLLACCLLVACFCLLLLVFVGCLFPSRAGRQSWEAEPRGTATCHVSVTFPVRFRYASVTFPLRFRYVSVVRLPVAPARGKCIGSLRQRAITKETSLGARE